LSAAAASLYSYRWQLTGMAPSSTFFCRGEVAGCGKPGSSGDVELTWLPELIASSSSNALWPHSICYPAGGEKSCSGGLRRAPGYDGWRATV